MSAPRLTVRQLLALVAVLTRELTWVAPNVATELDLWRARAATIPDGSLRTDALATLQRDRLNPEGAALFTVLPRRRNHGLLRVLVAYQVALDFLDTISERPSSDSLAHGMQLHRALIEALEPGESTLSDYYALRPWQDDGGYLRALVETCRTGCAELPGYLVVRSHATQAARRLSVQVLNHQPEEDRALHLAAFAHDELDATPGTTWFERAAAASSTLGIYALLALAVDQAADAIETQAIDAAYHPWVCLACTLLDCFVDQQDDAEAGNHNYLNRYADRDVAAERLCTVVARSVGETARLQNGERHTVVTGAMVAMYLSKASVRGDLQMTARRVASEGGALVQFQLPILRAIRWRHGVANG